MSSASSSTASNNWQLPASMDAFVNLLEPARMPSMTKRWRPQVPNIQRPQLTPKELKQSVLAGQRMQLLIDKHSAATGASRRQIEYEIRRHLDEIGLACSMPVIRWSGICLNRILQRICSAVRVNEHGMQTLKRRIGQRPVLYLPSHRSYMDFVMMSYVCFAYDLAIPGIAAGMDFHGMAGVGRLIRMTCAFFMRRSFAAGDDGDALYWQVFEEYVHQLVTVYHTGLEFFVEGTRSRSFKALPPKCGLLSMALQPLFVGRVADVQIVPIGVAYDRPLEEQLFAYEMLGVPKPRESTRALFGAMRILAVNHGALYVNFGEPMSAREYFGQQLQQGDRRREHAALPVHVQRLSRAEMELCAGLAQRIVVEQQRLIVLTVFNVLACVYWRTLAAPGAGPVAVRSLATGVRWLTLLLAEMGALVALDAQRGTADVLAAVDDALAVHGNLFRVLPSTTGSDADEGGRLELLRPALPTVRATARTVPALRAHQLAAETLRTAVPVMTLQIYANPCMFWLAPAAFALLAVRTLEWEQRGGAEALEDAGSMEPLRLAAVADVYAHLRRLFAEEFVLAADDAGDCGHQVDRLVRWRILDGRTLRVATTTTMDADAVGGLELLLSTVVPFVFCYRWVALTVCEDFGGEAFAERELLVRVQQRVEAAMVAAAVHVHPYCLSLDCVSHAVRAFETNGYLRKTKSAGGGAGDAAKAVTYRCSTTDSMRKLSAELLVYCQLLPFDSSGSSAMAVHPTSMLAKL